MKRILGIAMVLSLMAFIAGCSKEKAPQIKAESASEKIETAVTVEPKKEKAPQIKAESAVEKFETASNERGITKEPTKKDSSGKEEVIDLGKDVKLEMILIPAGKFMMGSPASEKNRSDNETQHEVSLTKLFYMGKYEVTQEQWFEIMGVNPSRKKGRMFPVTDVSWNDCQDFIKKLNAKTNGGYRLPTEAEWEYACRAGTTTAYSCGDNLKKSDANIDGDSIKAVGSYRPNAFGLYDMHGNVFEWCNDCYANYPAGAVIDPKGPATGKSRVLRGGSYYWTASIARSSNRNLIFTPTPSNGNDLCGLRVARNP